MRRRALRRRYGRSTGPGQKIKFGDHDLSVSRDALDRYWIVSGPKVLRGGRLDSGQSAYYGTIHDVGKMHAWGGKGEAIQSATSSTGRAAPAPSCH